MSGSLFWNWPAAASGVKIGLLFSARCEFYFNLAFDIGILLTVKVVLQLLFGF